MLKARHFLIALALTFLISSGGGLASALGSATIEVYPTSKTVELGTEFSIDITVNSTVPVTGVQFNLSFNPSVVKVTKVEKGDIFGSGSFFEVIGGVNNTAGTISSVINVSIGTSTYTRGSVAKVYLEAVGKGSSQITLENVIIGDENANELPVSKRSGTIYVAEQTGGGNNIQSPENGPSSPQNNNSPSENKTSARQPANDITIPLMAGLGVSLGSVVSIIILKKRTARWQRNHESMW